MSILNEIEVLSRVILFKGLTPQRLKLIAFTSQLYEFKENETIFKQNEEGHEAFVILEGSVDVIVDIKGKDVVVNAIGANEIVGGNCFTFRKQTNGDH